MSRTGKAALAILALGLALAAIQVIPVDRRNPAVEKEIPAPPEVRTILRHACYDCHSNETVWPWYSRYAPVSWWIASDVHEGRDHFNMSAWNRLDEEKRAKIRRKAWKEVDEGEMPPWLYRMAHPEARLSPREKALLREWLR